MSKMFELDKYGNLLVILNNEDTVFLPVDGKREDVGTYVQRTIQKIKADKVKILKKFIEGTKDNGEKQLKQLKEQLEPIKDLQDIDESIIKQCKSAIDKGTKPFKTAMAVLDKRIKDLDKKKALIMQIEYVEKELEEVNTDLESLNKLLK